MVEWLRGARPPLVRGTELRAWVDAQPPGPWIELLREALDEHALEVGEDTEVPVGHFIEWLAEWGWNVRRRQRGLMLLTAHRAKGLEFDHVAVLDGGWERRGRGEDADAPRRLYYVAMTRARQTLALARFGDRQGMERPNFVGEPAAPAYAGRSHPLPHAFPDGGAFLHRSPGVALPEAPELARRYRRLGLDDVYLSFAGRCHPRHPVHRAIAALSPEDPLEVRVDEQGRWNLLDGSGTAVGRLAASFEPPAGTRPGAATVLAVVAWSREASEPRYRAGLRCDAWEVVVPELVFEPC